MRNLYIVTMECSDEPRTQVWAVTADSSASAERKARLEVEKIESGCWLAAYSERLCGCDVDLCRML